MIPCEDGTYQDEIAKTSCKKCTAGNFCTKNASGSPGAIAVTPCPKGYYCPEGTPYENSFPCPTGTYSDSTGYMNSYQVFDNVGTLLYAGCKPCPATFYCPKTALIDTAYTSFKCKKGYKCA